MADRPKFRPMITRIKLNPEQAVLACACYSASRAGRLGGTSAARYACYSTRRTTRITYATGTVSS